MSDPPTDTQLPAQISPPEQLLTAAEFQRLADVPPEVEWFANIRNRSTRRAYENGARAVPTGSLRALHGAGCGPLIATTC